ncbi:hypothetical protein E4T49_00189 [Aureobasidium sp. EXF-10728]|nr:hypothetical protein E4T49_00189 [Aureobasidium sp. EXF-10728]
MAADIAAIPDGVMPRVVTITDNHDLTLRIFQYTEPLKAGEDGSNKIKAVVDFYVTRKTLIENSESDFIKKLLTTLEFAEAGKRIIPLHEHNTFAVETVLCAIYHKNEAWRSSLLGQTVTARTLRLHWEYLWDVVACNRFFMIESFHLDDWFSLWYEINGDEHNWKLLYPCYQFNHAEAFLAITKNLVYDHSHIKEYKNEEHPDLHVPPRVIHQLNSARGHLRTLLAKWLWEPLHEMMRVSCHCKEKTVYQYLQALTQTGGFPIDQQTRKSINTICRQLGAFARRFNLPKSSKNCRNCNKDWVDIVARAVIEVQGHFDGMCHDCMDHSQPKFMDEHVDYWYHLKPNKWDRDCRVSHGEASWYSSFMGRADTRDRLLRRVRPDKRALQTLM